MTMTTDAPALQALSKPQFVTLMAMLMAINAISIDIMLPGLQEIGASLGVTDENTRQYVITAYLLGMGCAQLFFGPLSDRFGRKLPLLGGLGVYALCALVIVFVPSFAGLLALRFMQGIGAAATRVITLSIVRDVYGGRMMAEVMSLVMMVFMIVPVIAPSIGQLIMIFAEWHMIFVVICLFALLVATLVALRLPETLSGRTSPPVHDRVHRRRIPHRADQPRFALLFAGCILHLRRAVRLHQFRAAGLWSAYTALDIGSRWSLQALPV